MFERLKHDSALRQRVLAMGVVALALFGLLGGIALWGILTFMGTSGGRDADASDPPCRPCQALAIYEINLRRALRADPSLADIADTGAVERVLGEVAGWRRRCSTLMCPAGAGETLSCRAPPASLLSELAAIEDAADQLVRRSAVCSQGGCLSADCADAQAVRAAFVALQSSVGELAGQPAAIAGEDRALATPFLFDRLAEVDDTVLTVPGLVAGGKFAAAEIRLLLLRDEAHDSAARAPGSVEIFVADRLGATRNAVDAVASARRRAAPADEVLERWGELAAAGSHLLMETASLRGEQGERPDPFRALAQGDLPGPVRLPSGPCEGAVQLVQSVEMRLGDAAGRLGQCFKAAACAPADDEADVAGPRARGARLGRRALMERISADRQAALEALRPFRLKREADVALATDLKAYLGGEAVTVRPLEEANQCLAETSSRLVLDRVTGEGAEAELERVGEHALTGYDPSVWFFEAPEEEGTYLFRLLTSAERGDLEFGRGQPLAVTAFSGPCTGFTGTWESDFGALRLVVRDGVARGTYRQSTESRAGILQGQVENGRLTGRWLSELGTGGSRLILSEDGLSFRGTWGSEPGRVSGAGVWNGTCIAEAAAGPAPKAGEGESAATRADDPH